MGEGGMGRGRHGEGEAWGGGGMGRGRHGEGEAWGGGGMGRGRHGEGEAWGGRHGEGRKAWGGGREGDMGRGREGGMGRRGKEDIVIKGSCQIMDLNDIQHINMHTQVRNYM